MADGLNLRERKKEQTRAALAKSAVRLFLKQGFDATTIDEICERANYSRRTFFRHFATKENIVFGDLPERVPAVMARLSEDTDGSDPIGVVRGALIEFTLAYLESADESAVQLWYREPALHRRFAELALDFEQAIADYLQAHPADPSDGRVEAEIEATALAGVVRAVMRARATEPQELEADDVVAALNRGFDLVTDGVARPLPRRRRAAR
jgi:AcrR family transcriptional regulator